MIRASYGDVTAEYRALRNGVATVDGTHDLVWVTGPDSVSFLQGILSQDIESMAPGEVARSFFLNPNGKLKALLWILRGDDRVGIFTDAGLGSVVSEGLAYYRIRVKAEIETDDRPVTALIGPEAGDTLDLAPVGWVERTGFTAAACPLPGLDRILVAGDSGLSGQPRAGSIAYTTVRVEAGEPVMDRDVDEKTIPQETGLVPMSVSFTKGCYLGQELVARIDSRGHVNRHLRGVVVTTNLLPPEGAALWAEDREVGVLTSVSESLGVMAPIGLSLVRREVEPGSEVELRWEGGAVPAVVRDLPLV